MTSEGTDTSRFGSDPTGVWAAADCTAETEWLNATNPSVLRTNQRAWERAVESDFPAGGDITCDPWTFMPLRETVFTAVAITGPDPALATQALNEAADRMLGVVIDGREVSEEELERLLDEDNEEAYSPDHISQAVREGDIVGIANIDTNGERYPWMFRTFLRIIAEELRRAQAVPARIIPFLTPEALTWLAERDERYPLPDGLD